MLYVTEQREDPANCGADVPITPYGTARPAA